MKYPEIAKRFKYIMNVKGLKQVDLVNKTGISKASINQYVQGRHCPENDRALILSKVLDVNPLWLMGFDVEMETEKEKVLTMEEVPERLIRYLDFINLYAELPDDKRNLVDNMILALAEKK